MHPSGNKNALEAFINKRALPPSENSQLPDELKAIQDVEQLKVEENGEENNKKGFPSKFNEDDLNLLEKKTKNQSTRKSLDRRTKKGTIIRFRCI